MNLIIDDRKRSLQVPEDDRGVCGNDGPAVCTWGMKIYRWAKRTGDWELRVCLDRQPQTDTKW